MEFQFTHHVSDYSGTKRIFYFQIGAATEAFQIIENLDYVDEVRLIDEGLEITIAFQQVPDIVKVLVQNNFGIYSIKSQGD